MGEAVQLWFDFTPRVDESDPDSLGVGVRAFCDVDVDGRRSLPALLLCNEASLEGLSSHQTSHRMQAGLRHGQLVCVSHRHCVVHASLQQELPANPISRHSKSLKRRKKGSIGIPLPQLPIQARRDSGE